MKHFYAGTFINRDDLKSIGIEYPIKLEYYKTRPNIEVTKNENKIKYGIEVVKTSYINCLVSISDKLPIKPNQLDLSLSEIETSFFK